MALLDNIRSRNRHRRLINLANALIRDYFGTINDAAKVTPADYIAYVFGCCQIRLDDAEAIDYLNAALVARGLPRLDAKTGA